MAAELNAPAFYTHQRESLRPAVLIYAAALATVLWAAVFVLIGHSADRGSFFIGTHRAAEPAIGSFQRPRDPAEPDVATRLNPEPDDPLADYKKAYFRTILVLLAIDTDHNYVISGAEIANAHRRCRGWTEIMTAVSRLKNAELTLGVRSACPL